MGNRWRLVIGDGWWLVLLLLMGGVLWRYWNVCKLVHHSLGDGWCLLKVRLKDLVKGLFEVTAGQEWRL